MPKTENLPVDPLIGRYEERYEYDIENTALYGTDNNRLMKIVRTRIDTEPGGGQQSATFFDPTGGKARCLAVPHHLDLGSF